MHHLTVDVARAAVQADVDPWAQHFAAVAWVDVTLAYRYRYDLSESHWHVDTLEIVREPTSFAEGAMRRCFRTKLVASGSPLSGCQSPALADLVVRVRGRESESPRLVEHANFVLKQYKSTDGAAQRVPLPPGGTAPNGHELLARPELEVIAHDVQMQLIAKDTARAFNLLHPPRAVDVLEAFVVVVPTGDGFADVYAGEAYVPGRYVKHNSNHGFVGQAVMANSDVGSELDSGAGSSAGAGASSAESDLSTVLLEQARATPQAFSHFSFVYTSGLSLIVDVQGVGDLLTDPQIHTMSGEGFGVGNLGPVGVAMFFRTHLCTSVCRQLGLPEFHLTHDERARASECYRLGETAMAKSAEREPGWLASRSLAAELDALVSSHPGLRRALLASAPEQPDDSVSRVMASVHYAVFALAMREALAVGEPADGPDQVFHLLAAARAGHERARALVRNGREAALVLTDVHGIDLLAVEPPGPWSMPADRVLRVVVWIGVGFALASLASRWLRRQRP